MALEHADHDTHRLWTALGPRVEASSVLRTDLGGTANAIW